MLGEGRAHHIGPLSTLLNGDIDIYIYMGDFMSTVEGQNFKNAQNFFSRSKLAPKGKYRVLDQNIQAF